MPLISLFCWGLAVWFVIKQFKWSWKLSLSLSIVVKLRFLFCFFPFSFIAINRTASNVCRSTAGFSLLQQLCSEWDWEGTSGESRKSPTDTADERRERCVCVCVCARTLSCVMYSKGKRHYSTAHGQKDTIPSLHTCIKHNHFLKSLNRNPVICVRHTLVETCRIGCVFGSNWVGVWGFFVVFFLKFGWHFILCKF